VTKVELQFSLLRPLTDADAEAVARAHAHYGFLRIRVAPALDALDIDYDATRLTEKDVEAALVRYGVPIRRQWTLD
jgi:hypothetical protein